MNEVELDQAALMREADSIVSDIPPDSSSLGDVDASSGGGLQTSPEGAAPEMSLEQIQAAAANWEPGTQLIVGELFDTLAPAWKVTTEEKNSIAHTFALVLGAWVPGESIPPKYLVLMMAGGSLYSVVRARRDPDTGELMPRKLKKANDEQRTPAATESTGGGFSTAA